MKTNRRINLFLLVLILLGTTIACDKSENELKDPSPFTIENEHFTFYKNSALSHEASKSRSESYSAPFEIISVERIEDDLYINIMYQAGCKVNMFEIIWDGLIMESYPTQTRLFVKRNASQCTLADIKESLTLTVDLKELAVKSGNDQILEAVITVSNASKKHNGNNANVPVSSN